MVYCADSEEEKMKQFVALLVLGLFFIAGCEKQSAETEPTIPWEEAVELIHEGKVQSAFQTHTLTVSLRLNDGTMVKTKEPKIDAIFQEIRNCGEPCKDVGMATE